MLALLVCLAILLPSPASAATPERTYLAHLRERHMYRLAEVYARERLADPDIAPRDRVEFAIELSLIEVARAYDAPPAVRDTHWQAAHQALAPWLDDAEAAGRLLAELQDALNLLAAAELSLAENTGRAPASLETVQGRLRSALAQLREVAQQVEIERRQLAMGTAPRHAEFDETALAGLERSVALELARGYRLQAGTYPSGSPDRVNAVQQAAESLERLAAGRPADATVWRARVLLAESLAQLGQTTTGLDRLARWREEGVPQNFEGPLTAARARLEAAAGRQGAALETLTAAANLASPEVDLARLELLLAGEVSETAAIESLLASIRQRYAPRYIRQAEAMVGERFASTGESTTAMAAVHAAQHFYRAGQLAAAVAAYDQAAERFRNERDRDQAFAAERSAAAIVQQQRGYAEAAARFRRLALGSVDRHTSAEDHREAILCQAAVVGQAAGAAQSEALAEYLRLAREHLNHWPESTTTGEVRWWLVRALASRGQHTAVLEALDQVDPSSPYYEQSMALAATAYRHQLAATPDAAKRAALARTAAEVLQPVVVGTGDSARWPSEWSEAQRSVALELARLMLTANNAGYAETLLTMALKPNPAPTAEYADQASAVLAMALVEQGKTAEAIDLLRSADRTGGGASLQSLARQLTTQLTDHARGDLPAAAERSAIGQLLLAVLDMPGLDTSSWDPPADRYRAAALAAVGNRDAALGLYAQLARQLPKNGTVQEEYAQLLAAGDAAADREVALTAYARIESATRRGSDRWQRARRARIGLLIELGRTDEAQKLEKLTRLLGGAAGSE